MTQDLIRCAFDHLLRYELTGCSRSAHLAASLLDRLAAQRDIDSETRHLCCCMSAVLEQASGTSTAYG